MAARSTAHRDLVQLGVGWLRGRRYKVVLAESGHYYGDCLPDVLGWAVDRLGVRSVLIEAKASRADFLRDKAKPIHQTPDKYPGQERLYLAPAGVVTVADLPAEWGLLHPRPNGQGCQVIRRGVLGPTCRREAEMPYLLAALRRIELGLGFNRAAARCEPPQCLQDIPADLQLELYAELLAKAASATPSEEEAEEDALRAAEGAQSTQMRLFTVPGREVGP